MLAQKQPHITTLVQISDVESQELPRKLKEMKPSNVQRDLAHATKGSIENIIWRRKHADIYCILRPSPAESHSRRNR